MPLPISAIILTYNEEKNIQACISTIKDLVSEIFVVDSGSFDSTIEIAKRYTSNIFFHPFENFAQQRNWAQDNLPLKNEWVFHLDADEQVSEKLSSELKHIFGNDISVDGFMMPRKTVFRNRFIRFGGHYPVYHLRLFKKSKGRSEMRLYDQNYKVDGKVLKLQGEIINIISTDLREWKRRHRNWAKLEAREIIYNSNRIMNIKFFGSPIEQRNWLRYKVYYHLPIFLRAFVYFFYRFFLKFGFLDGFQGLIFHFWHGLWYRLEVDLNILKLFLERSNKILLLY